MPNTKPRPSTKPRSHPVGISLPPSADPEVSSATSPAASGTIEMPTSSEPLHDDAWTPPELSPDASRRLHELAANGAGRDEEPAEDDGDAFAALVAAPASEGQVRALLTAQGFMVNKMIGRDEAHFIWTEDELDLVAPGLARIAKRSNLVRRAAEASDGIAVAAGVGGYLFRNILNPPQPQEAPRENRTAQAADVEGRGEGTDVDGGPIPVGLPPR